MDKLIFEILDSIKIWILENPISSIILLSILIGLIYYWRHRE